MMAPCASTIPHAGLSGGTAYPRVDRGPPRVAPNTSNDSACILSGDFSGFIRPLFGQAPTTTARRRRQPHGEPRRRCQEIGRCTSRPRRTAGPSNQGALETRTPSYQWRVLRPCRALPGPAALMRSDGSRGRGGGGWRRCLRESREICGEVMRCLGSGGWIQRRAVYPAPNGITRGSELTERKGVG